MSSFGANLTRHNAEFVVKENPHFQRFPGVEGSLYFVGGFGVNYLQRDGISLAPVRFGVGWRQGIAVSYMHFTRNKRLTPL